MSLHCMRIVLFHPLGDFITGFPGMLEVCYYTLISKQPSSVVFHCLLLPKAEIYYIEHINTASSSTSYGSLLVALFVASFFVLPLTLSISMLCKKFPNTTLLIFGAPLFCSDCCPFKNSQGSLIEGEFVMRGPIL